MATRYKTIQCARCGCDIIVGSGTRKPRHCKACNLARYIENMVSLKSKTGAPYERLIAAQRKARSRGRQGGSPEK